MSWKIPGGAEAALRRAGCSALPGNSPSAAAELVQPKTQGEPRRLESLPFFQRRRYSSELKAATLWRQDLKARQPFQRPYPLNGTIKFFARPLYWRVKPSPRDFNVNRSCDIACDYTNSLDDAHMSLSYIVSAAASNHRVVSALVSFEPQQLPVCLHFPSM